MRSGITREEAIEALIDLNDHVTGDDASAIADALKEIALDSDDYDERQTARKGLIRLSKRASGGRADAFADALEEIALESDLLEDERDEARRALIQMSKERCRSREKEVRAEESLRTRLDTTEPYQR